MTDTLGRVTDTGMQGSGWGRPVAAASRTFEEICLSVEYMARRSAAEPVDAEFSRASSTSPGERQHGDGEK